MANPPRGRTPARVRSGGDSPVSPHPRRRGRTRGRGRRQRSARGATTDEGAREGEPPPGGRRSPRGAPPVIPAGRPARVPAARLRSTSASSRAGTGQAKRPRGSEVRVKRNRYHDELRGVLWISVKSPLAANGPHAHPRRRPRLLAVAGGRSGARSFPPHPPPECRWINEMGRRMRPGPRRCGAIERGLANVGHFVRSPTSSAARRGARKRGGRAKTPRRERRSVIEGAAPQRHGRSRFGSAPFGGDTDP